MCAGSDSEVKWYGRNVAGNIGRGRGSPPDRESLGAPDWEGRLGSFTHE